MKSTLVAVLVAVFVVAIGAFIWNQQRGNRAEEQRRASEMQTEIQNLQTELAESKTRESLKASEAKPAITSPVVVVAATNSAAPLAQPNPALLQDPETRALMRKQQKQGLVRLADKLIDRDFVRDWNLTPDQINRVKELVREKAAAGKDVLNAMMFDGLDDDALAARGRETKQRIAQVDAGLREVIGDGGLEALKDRERTLEAQERVRRIRDELANVERPLSKVQQESLIETISGETRAYPFRVDLSDPSKVDFERLREFFAEANLQHYFEDMQQVNTRIVDRAAQFLSPEQIHHLKTTQQNQLEQARLTVKMTTELFNKPRGK